METKNKVEHQKLMVFTISKKYVHFKYPPFFLNLIPLHPHSVYQLNILLTYCEYHQFLMLYFVFCFHIFIFLIVIKNQVHLHLYLHYLPTHLQMLARHSAAHNLIHTPV